MIGGIWDKDIICCFLALAGPHYDQLKDDMDMTAQYSFIENISREEFEQFALSGGPHAHFLHSYAWGQVAATRGWIPFYVGVRQGEKLVATALLLKKRLPLGYSYFYIPRGFALDYENRELLEFMTRSVQVFGKKHRIIHFKIDPDIKLHTVDMDGNVIEGENNYALSEQLLSLGYERKPLNYFFEREQPRFTFRVPLEGSVERIEARYNQTTRSSIRQALSRQVEVMVGSRENIKDFTRLMAMTEKRQNFYSHDEEYYRHFYDILAEHNMVTLYLGKVNIPRLKSNLETELAGVEQELDALAEAAGKKAQNKKRDLLDRQKAITAQLENLRDKPMEDVIISACLTVHYADKAWSLYAGNDREYGKFFANYLVYQRQIRDAFQRGQTCFDLFGTVGRPDSSNRTGLYEFKKKWGGELTEFIGEYDHVENPLMYAVYNKLIPHYHRMMKNRLRRRAQKYAG